MSFLKIAASTLVFSLLLTGCSQLPQLSTTPESVETADLNNLLTQELLAHTTIKVPDMNYEVVLSGGNKTTDFGDVNTNPQAGYGSVTLGDLAVQVGNTIFSTIAVNTGGSGEFFYLAAFEENATGWEMTNAAPLEDRIDIQSLTVTESGIQVDFLDHSPDQAMYEAPTVPVSQTYNYTEGKLVLQS